MLARLSHVSTLISFCRHKALIKWTPLFLADFLYVRPSVCLRVHIAPYWPIWESCRRTQQEMAKNEHNIGEISQTEIKGLVCIVLRTPAWLRVWSVVHCRVDFLPKMVAQDGSWLAATTVLLCGYSYTCENHSKGRETKLSLLHGNCAFLFMYLWTLC